MGELQRRATLIDELSQHPTLNEEEVGLLHLARCNVARFSQPMLLGEEAEARRVFDELGFRLDRVKRRIEGSNVAVFRKPTIWVHVPQMTKARAG